MANHYGTLGVRADATAEELRRAYRRLALRHHPDRNPGDATAAVRFQAVQEAYEVLRDPARRATYDLLFGRPAPQARPAPAPHVRRPASSAGQPTRGVTRRAAVSFAAALTALGVAAVTIVHTAPSASPFATGELSSGAKRFCVAALGALVVAAGSWFAADAEREVLAHARAMRSHRLRGYAPNLPLRSPMSETIVALTLRVARVAFLAALLALATALNL